MISFVRSFAVVVSLALASSANATQILGVFGGEIDRLNSPSNSYGDAAGFGFIDEGDSFFGSFVIDADARRATSFSALVSGRLLVAKEIAMGVQPFDGYISYFYLRGLTESGLYFSLGLFDGQRRSSEWDVLSTLSSSDWVYTAFNVSRTGAAAIELGACNPDTTCGSASRLPGVVDNSVFVRSVVVPEPSTLPLALFGAACLMLGIVARRRAARE